MIREADTIRRVFRLIVGSTGISTLLLLSTGYSQHVVEINAEIFEYRIDEEHQRGIFHDWERHRGDLERFSVDLPGTRLVGDDPLAGVNLNLEVLNLLWGTVRTRLLAAVREGNATLVSNPTIIALEGTTAQILRGESFPTTRFVARGVVQKLEQHKVNTGVKLFVTPVVFRDEYIILSIQAESSELREQFVEFITADGRRYELPQISRRTAQTVVVLRSGQSLYIGGLIQESQGIRRRFIPGLSNIPLLGKAFAGSHRETITSETIFKITPTILKPGEGSSFYQRWLAEEPPPAATPKPSVLNILPSTPDASYLK